MKIRFSKFRFQGSRFEFLLILLFLIITIVSLLLFSIETSYRKDFLNSFIYPLSILTIGAIGTITFLERFKNELQINLFRNSKTYETQIQNCIDVIKDIEIFRTDLNDMMNLIKLSKPKEEIEKKQLKAVESWNNFRISLGVSKAFFLISSEESSKIMEIIGEVNSSIVKFNSGEQKTFIKEMESYQTQIFEFQNRFTEKLRYEMQGNKIN